MVHKYLMGEAMKKKLGILAICILAVSLAACGKARLNSYLDGFTGKPIASFIAHQGEPTKVVELSENSKLYEWQKNYSRDGSSGEISGSTVVSVNVNSSGPRERGKLWCNYRATTMNDIISDIVWEGTYCRPMN